MSSARTKASCRAVRGRLQASGGEAQQAATDIVPRLTRDACRPGRSDDAGTRARDGTGSRIKGLRCHVSGCEQTRRNCIKYIKKQLYLIEKSCYFVWIRETFISDQVMHQPSILLVEDDAFQRKAAETYLLNHDLKVIAVENGAQMRRQISRAMPDLVLLDVQLPGQEDGFALARWLRESSTQVGIIMLTAAGDSVDKVLGLESGADDYVAKPYEPRELLARCKSVLRRSANKTTPSLLERVRMGQPHARPAASASCSITAARTWRVTAGEFDILKTFAENPNRPLSRDWLLETTSHRSRDPFDRAIDLRITRIRRKIEPHAGQADRDLAPCAASAICSCRPPNR